MAADPNWTSSETLGFAAPGSQQMAVAAAGDTVHLVWVQSKTLYHSRWTAGAWQTPVRIAAGEQPALAVAADGSVYCAYANYFLGNRDIYFCTWSNGKWGLAACRFPHDRGIVRSGDLRGRRRRGPPGLGRHHARLLDRLSRHA